MAGRCCSRSPPATCSETTLRDLGEHRLKDLSLPQTLYQLLVDGLPSEFPALKTLENRPTNLPVQPTPLIGRQHEVEEVAALILDAEARLVTLTGAGGTDNAIAAAKNHVPPELFAAAWRVGRALPVEEAVKEATS
jgi:hypothetical protein